MKALMKVVVVLVAVICILSALPVKQAQAAPGWFTCYVNYTANTWGNWFVRLTNADGTTTPIAANTAYTIAGASATDTNAMFSVALTAMASGMKVVVYLTNTTEMSSMTSIGVTDQ